MTINRLIAVLAACVLVSLAVDAAQAFTLLSPTQDQIVREKVRLTFPLSAMPSEVTPSGGASAPEGRQPFVSVNVEQQGKSSFVAALSRALGVVRGGKITFFWDSKAPYRDPTAPKVEKFFKDGKYVVHVNIHDAQGKLTDSGSVTVQLRNKVARPNPAPGVSLVNRLIFGQTRAYGVHAEVGVFEVINKVGLPILGGLGITSDFKIFQTVDDARNDGTFLVRYRTEKGARVSSFGQVRRLYENEEFGPQLYRLVTKLGKVVKRNVFTRQAQYTIGDVLPMLPAKPVKEGDSWPCATTLKVEGITNLIQFTGTSMLDSFEWQDGHECAKIISRLAGEGTISMSGGKIRSESTKVEAQMTTYFAYRSGTVLRNETVMDFPALILPGAGEPGEEVTESETPSPGRAMPMDEEMDEVFQRTPGTPRTRPGARGGAQANGLPEGAKRGSVQVKVVFRLEK